MTYEQELTEYNQNRSKFHHIKPCDGDRWIVYAQTKVPTLKEAVEKRDKDWLARNSMKEWLCCNDWLHLHSDLILKVIYEAKRLC